MGGFNFALGTPSFNPSTPTMPSSVDFTDLSTAIPYLVNSGLKIYSTVAANNIAGQQVTNGQQPTALFVPQQYAVNPGAAASQIGGTGLLSAFTPGTWLLIIGVVLLIFLFKK
jgi:hypothetical protein